jgi:glutamate/tyrosine decarboxylase-like PLP-dependent enzyme
MNTPNSLQEAMLAEMKDKTLFEKAQQYALHYLDEVWERNIYPTENALQNLAVFEENMPEQTGNAEQVLSLLHEYGSPATVAQLGGRYFGFVTGSSVPAGLAAKNLATFWDQNAALQVMSPVVARLETVVQKWLIELFGLPQGTVVGFVSGTSMANLCGIAAARYKLLKNQGWDVTEQGMFGAPKIRIVAGAEAHSSVLKAVSLAGLGKANIEWVPSDEQGKIIAEQIPELDEKTLLILQAGNVNSGAFDDFEKICKHARAKGAWIHIDGAFGLWAGATEKLNHLTKGFELADSWAVDGHKTLNTPYDSGIILCRDEEAFVSALHATGSYLVKGTERDGMFYAPEMSRRARVVELWATLKYLGKNGIDEMVYGLHERAKQFAAILDQTEGFEVLNDVVFNQVVVCCETDERTTQTLAKIQELRECWAGSSVWRGKKVIRISVCSWATTREDIRRSADSFKKALEVVKNQTSVSS